MAEHGMAARTRNLGTRRRFTFSFTPWPLYPRAVNIKQEAGCAPYIE